MHIDVGTVSRIELNAAGDVRLVIPLGNEREDIHISDQHIHVASGCSIYINEDGVSVEA